MQHSHVLQVEALDQASVFPVQFDSEYHMILYLAVEMLFTKHTQYQWLELLGSITQQLLSAL